MCLQAAILSALHSRAPGHVVSHPVINYAHSWHACLPIIQSCRLFASGCRSIAAPRPTEAVDWLHLTATQLQPGCSGRCLTCRGLPLWLCFCSMWWRHHQRPASCPPEVGTILPSPPMPHHRLLTPLCPLSSPWITQQLFLHLEAPWLGGAPPATPRHHSPHPTVHSTLWGWCAGFEGCPAGSRDLRGAVHAPGGWRKGG